jgi:hypothetical protein
MSALTLLIIRHAKKPGESWPGSGLTPDGVPDKKSLVIRGWQRAGSWSALFGAGLGPICRGEGEVCILSPMYPGNESKDSNGSDSK